MLRSKTNLKILTNLDTMTFSGLQILFFAMVPFIAEQTNLGVSSVVASFSVGSFLFLWGSPFWAAKSDQWGRLPVLAIGMLGLAISTALLIIAITTDVKTVIPAAVLIWSSRVLYGLTASSIVPVAQSLQIDLSGTSSAMKALLANSMSLNAGRALGPLYILLGSAASIPVILWGALAWVAVLTLINLLNFKVPTAPLTNTEKSPEWLVAFAKMRSLFSLAILFTSFIGVLNFSLALILKNKFSLTSAEAGILMAQLLLVSALLALGFQSLGRVYFKSPWQGPLLVGATALILGAACLGAMKSHLILWAAIVLLSIGISLLPPSYMTLMANRNGREMGLGQRAGIIGTANTLGYAMGGLLAAGTFQVSFISVETVMLILGLLIALNILVLYRSRGIEVAHV